MATVTKKFRDDFEVWAADRLTRGEFTQANMEEFKEILRKDLAPGPDKVRAGVVVVVDGVEISAAIDSAEERYAMWAEYFADEAQAIGDAAKPAPLP